MLTRWERIGLGICLLVIALVVILSECLPRITRVEEKREYRVIFPLMFNNYSTKRGIALTYGAINDLSAIGAAWYYDWSAFPPLFGSMEAVPMIGARTPDKVGAVGGSPGAPIAGVNEPNVRQQTNICPRDYVETWHRIEEMYPDRALVSPGVGHYGNDIAGCGAMGGLEWLAQFRAAYIEQYDTAPRLDAISVHFYFWRLADFKSFMEQTVALASEWDAEVWLTEFSFRRCDDIAVEESCVNGVDHGEAFVANELHQAVAWLDNEPRVMRYAYFANRMHGQEPGFCEEMGTYECWYGAAERAYPALLDWQTSTLTAYGRAYIGK